MTWGSVASVSTTSTNSPGQRASSSFANVALRTIVPVPASTVLSMKESSPIWLRVELPAGDAATFSFSPGRARSRICTSEDSGTEKVT
jgi:hypothetical protein